jgi:xylulose-5-phosphate/fructose-6-phosphate phosphoketolase
MVVLNNTSRFHLVIEALRRTRRPPTNVNLLIDACEEILMRHHAYVREHLEDLPEINDFAWPRA